MTKEIKLFSTKIDTWGSPVTIRAFNKTDAENLARIIFKVSTEVEITATAKEIRIGKD